MIEFIPSQNYPTYHKQNGYTVLIINYYDIAAPLKFNNDQYRSILLMEFFHFLS